jgi:hypothetical protein
MFLKLAVKTALCKFTNPLKEPKLYQTSSNLSTTAATRRKLSGVRTAASIMRREACSACLNPGFVRREPQLNHPNSNWN